MKNSSHSRTQVISVILLIATVIIWPLLSVLLWLILLRQYHLSFVKRALIFILFGMGGTWFILASLMNGEGVLSFDWAMVIPAFIFSIIPMVYSLIWPQTRKTHKGTKKS